MKYPPAKDYWGRPMYYDLLEDHSVVPLEDMAKWPDADRRRVARETVGEADVSTVFLVLDHGHGGIPMLFESMVFGGEYDQWQDRYPTYDMAVRGHERIVENLKAGRDPGWDVEP